MSVTDFEIVYIDFDDQVIAVSSIDEAWQFLASWPGGLYTEAAHLAGIALTQAEGGKIPVHEARQAFVDFLQRNRNSLGRRLTALGFLLAPALISAPGPVKLRCSDLDLLDGYMVVDHFPLDHERLEGVVGCPVIDARFFAASLVG